MTSNKKQIMRRVYTIWVGRKLFNRTTLKMLVLGTFLYKLPAYVSVQNVISNWHFDGGFSASYAFLQSAVLNTEIMTQGLVLGIALFSVLLVRDMLVSPSAQIRALAH